MSIKVCDKMSIFSVLFIILPTLLNKVRYGNGRIFVTLSWKDAKIEGRGLFFIYIFSYM